MKRSHILKQVLALTLTTSSMVVTGCPSLASPLTGSLDASGIGAREELESESKSSSDDAINIEITNQVPPSPSATPYVPTPTRHAEVPSWRERRRREAMRSLEIGGAPTRNRPAPRDDLTTVEDEALPGEDAW